VVAERTAQLAETNEALTLSNRDLLQSNTNVQEFACAASHDLKEPVRKILNFAERLKNSLEEKLDATQSGLFSRMEQSVQRMGTLIDDLLACSHLNIGVGDQEQIDLNKKVQFVLEDLELAVQEKGAKVTVAKLPVIKGSRCQMQQLFQNLTSKSLQYSRGDANRRYT